MFRKDFEMQLQKNYIFLSYYCNIVCENVVYGDGLRAILT